MYIIAWQKSGSVRDFPTEQQEGKPGTGEGKGRGSVGRAVQWQGTWREREISR